MNIIEIAELAGVSRAAVSRYLNQGYLSEEKSERIRKVIEKTGYVPSLQAQTLRTKKTKMIGIIVPKISSEAISRMVDGITATIEPFGHQALLANTDNQLKKELEYLGVFNNRQVDGVLFVATILTRQHKKILGEMKIPVVLAAQQLDGFCCVYHDDYNCAKELTRLLLEKGRRHIGYIGVEEKDIAAGYSRKKGYLDAHQETGLVPDPALMAHSAFTQDSGYEHMKQLAESCALCGLALDGVFCATDSIAIGAITYLKENGISVPEQIAITGVGDTRMSKVVTPQLTTAHLHYKTCGVEAARMLMDQIQEGKREIRELKLGYEIISRNST